jgi:bacillithiol system protein YtxJ
MTIPWKPLTSKEEVEQIKNQSQQSPVLIYKHSMRCGVSAAAKMRLEDGWPLTSNEVPIYYVDVLKDRPVSAFVADTFQVHHESPQILVIRNGECVYEESHFGIRVSDLKEVLLPEG